MKFLSAFFFMLLLSSAVIAQSIKKTASLPDRQSINQVLNEPAHGNDQGNDIGPNSFDSTKLDYTILSADSVAKLRAISSILLTHDSAIVVYEGDDGLCLAYATKDPNKWISVSLPFSSEYFRTDAVYVNRVNIDKKGQQELVIEGQISNYGAGGGITEYLMQILNIDADPVQLLYFAYGWGEESFGDKTNDGAGSYDHVYIRKVSVTEQGISLSSDPEGKTSNYDIPNGKYVFTDGRLISANERDYVKPNEKIIMQFYTQAGKRLVLAIDTNNKHLVYRYGTQNHVELQYPNTLNNSIDSFKLAFEYPSATKSKFSYGQLHFSNKEVTYNIYNQYDEESKISKVGLIVTDNKTHKKTLIQGNINTLKGQLNDLTTLPNIKLQKEYLLDVD